MPRFIGSDIDGVKTSTRQRIKKIHGIMMLTLIGRGASGLEFVWNFFKIKTFSTFEFLKFFKNFNILKKNKRYKF